MVRGDGMTKKLTKEQIRKLLKEIKGTIRLMESEIKDTKVEELGRDTFEDLMCLSSELYYTYSDAYYPE